MLKILTCHEFKKKLREDKNNNPEPEFYWFLVKNVYYKQIIGWTFRRF